MIGFLQPLALLGLLLAAVPPLLHLLGRRRPPTVLFPAVRYLAATEREHSKRLKLRNLILMLLRVAIIVLVVLAAARPVARIGRGGSHQATAVALVLDNSLSSGAVVGGNRVLDALRDGARRVVERITEDDRLWLVLADGVPQRRRRVEALALLDSLSAWPLRLDLGQAVSVASRAVEDAGLSGSEVIVLSDLQATALSAARVETRVLALEPPPVPENVALDSARADPPVWVPRGAVLASLGGSSDRQRGVRLSVEERDVARAVATAGSDVALEATLPARGWFRAAVALDPDELRADDRWWLGLTMGAPAAVRVESGAGRFVAEGVRVLVEGGLARDGALVVVSDRLRDGTIVLVPPADRSLVGAANRALAARGVSVRFGDVVDGEWSVGGDVASVSGVPVYRRHRLGGSAAVLATAGGEPWLVREDDVIVLASRLDPTWTTLPVSAAFVPFLDALLNRIAAQEMWIVRSTPGAVAAMPAAAEAVVLPGGNVSVPADGRFVAPLETGVFFLLGGAGDTVGALEVNHDPRESRLDAATPAQVGGAFGPQASVLGTAAFERELFGGARRADLTGALLVAALLTALAELAIASFGSRPHSA
jgi:hypothetical protein